MYKVLIADDEVWIGFGIKKLIHRDWGGAKRDKGL